MTNQLTKQFQPLKLTDSTHVEVELFHIDTPVNSVVHPQAAEIAPGNFRTGGVA